MPKNRFSIDEMTMEACSTGNSQFAWELLQRGANVNYRDQDGWTCLIMASYYNHSQVVELLLSHPDTKINYAAGEHQYTALLFACSAGNLEVVKALTKNNRLSINQVDSLQRTGLHIAALKNNTNVMKYLISKTDIDVNAQDVKGATALYVAAAEGKTEAVKVLLDHYMIDPNLGNISDATPLHAAAGGGHFETVEVLIRDNFVNNYAKDVTGRTAADVAKKENHLEIALFIQSGGKMRPSGERQKSVGDQIQELLSRILFCFPNSAPPQSNQISPGYDDNAYYSQHGPQSNEAASLDQNRKPTNDHSVNQTKQEESRNQDGHQMFPPIDERSNLLAYEAQQDDEIRATSKKRKKKKKKKLPELTQHPMAIGLTEEEEIPVKKGTVTPSTSSAEEDGDHNER